MQYEVFSVDSGEHYTLLGRYDTLTEAMTRIEDEKLVKEFGSWADYEIKITLR